LLIIFPFVVFAVVPAIVMLFSLMRSKVAVGGPIKSNGIPPMYIFSLVGVSILGFLPALFFFWVDMRYMFDFVPELALLAVLGFWQSGVYLSRRPIMQNLILLAGSGLALFSIVVGVLAAANKM